jgi:hypothetical protein
MLFSLKTHREFFASAAFITSSGRSAWFVGVLVLMVYLVFAMTLHLLPPPTEMAV